MTCASLCIYHFIIYLFVLENSNTDSGFGYNNLIFYDLLEINPPIIASITP